MQILSEENWAIIAPFLVIQIILMIVAFIDWLKNDQSNGPKWMWLLIILFVSIIGPVLYFIFGRRQA